MKVFIITTHRHLPGVRLSLRGNWGNIPYPDDEAAANAARAQAKGAYVIERENHKK